MGLDTTHGCWRGAYSAFSRWREQIAQVAGYKMMDPTPEEQAQGFFKPYPMIEWSGVTGANLQGEWSRTPPDPLIVLIAHSDCDGVIHPEQAGPLADRLTELLPLLPEGSGGGHIGDWREKTQAFIDGLRDAVDAREDVEFY